MVEIDGGRDTAFLSRIFDKLLVNFTWWVNRVDDNGDKNFVAATKSDKGMVIRGPKGVHTWESALYPTNHWNAGVLSQKHVLNTLTGDVASVEIRSEGRDKVEAEGKMIEATRYRYSGDIDTTVWYDDDGRWVKMRFVAKGGSTIDYNCTRCGPGGAQAATAN